MTKYLEQLTALCSCSSRLRVPSVAIQGNGSYSLGESRHGKKFSDVVGHVVAAHHAEPLALQLLNNSCAELSPQHIHS